MFFVITMIAISLAIVRILLSFGTPTIGRFIDWGRVSNNSCSLVRGQFFDLPGDTTKKVSTSKPHADSAARRSCFGTFADRLCSMSGKQPFYYQMSKRDVIMGRDGNRSYYWASDLSTPYSNKKPKSGNIIIMVDVDYYVDLPKMMLSNSNCPILMYTFVPDCAAAVRYDCNYTFNTDGDIMVNYDGGSCFKHCLWDYNTDLVMVYNTFLGLTYRAASYNVDTRRYGPDRQAVLLTPIDSWGPMTAQLVRMTITARTLARLDVVRNGFACFFKQENGKATVSVAKCGNLNSADVDRSIFECISVVTRKSKHEIQLGTIMSHVQGDKATASTLYEYFTNNGMTKIPQIMSPQDSVLHYQFKPLNYTPEAKISLMGFMSPIVIGGSYAPDRCVSNEQRAVEYRVKRPASDVQASPDLARKMREFASVLFPTCNLLFPVDYQEVFDKQARPSQRSIIETWELSGNYYDRKIKAFIKSESYGDANDPRLISQICPQDKIDYSTYMYALADHLKTQSWYAFGKTPKLIEERVAEVCFDAKMLDLGDYSRFDGTISPACRELEQVIVMRGFQEKYHNDLYSQIKTQQNCKARLPLGVTYDTKTSRLSGSPETSVFNTIDNAFVAYCAYRYANPELTPAQCYAKLGMFGGDDSFNPDIDSKIFRSVSEQMGLKLKNNVVMRGNLGVNFLGRHYTSDVWYGETTNMCDIKKQLCKLHTVGMSRAKVSPLLIAHDKALSYSYTDSETPILGQWAMGFLRHWQGINGKGTDSWWCQFDKEVQFTNRFHIDFNNMFHAALPDFDRRNWLRFIDSCDSCESYLRAPICLVLESDVKAPVVVNGDVVDPLDKPLVPARLNRRKLISGSVSRAD